MSGKGRHTKTAELHPHRACGPVCHFCKKTPIDNKYTHPALIPNSDTVIKSHWAKLQQPSRLGSFDENSCICWPCKKALVRRSSEEAVVRHPIDCHDELPIKSTFTTTVDARVCRKHRSQIQRTRRVFCGQCQSPLSESSP